MKRAWLHWTMGKKVMILSFQDVELGRSLPHRVSEYEKVPERDKDGRRETKLGLKSRNLKKCGMGKELLRDKLNQ